MEGPDAVVDRVRSFDWSNVMNVLVTTTLYRLPRLEFS
jgi:hypothetical protein